MPFMELLFTLHLLVEKPPIINYNRIDEGTLRVFPYPYHTDTIVYALGLVDGRTKARCHTKRKGPCFLRGLSREASFNRVAVTNPSRETGYISPFSEPIEVILYATIYIKQHTKGTLNANIFSFMCSTNSLTFGREG